MLKKSTPLFLCLFFLLTIGGGITPAYAQLIIKPPGIGLACGNASVPKNFACVEPPPPGCKCMDIVLAIDDTGSMRQAIKEIKAGLTEVIDTALQASGDPQNLRVGVLRVGDRVLLVQDLVDVGTDAGRQAVEAAIDQFKGGGGGGRPEASDEAVNIGARREVSDPDCLFLHGREIIPDPRTLAMFRGSTPSCRRLVILITNGLPGGCDDTYTEEVSGGDDCNALQAATDAFNGTFIAVDGLGGGENVLVSAILVDNKDGSLITPRHPDGVEPDVMFNYACVTGGTFDAVPYTGEGAATAIREVIEAATCNAAVVPPIGLVAVASIVHSLFGGKTGDKHLSVTANLDPPVQGAIVSITLNKDGTFFKSLGGISGADGSVVFDVKNLPPAPPPECYSSTVSSLAGEGLVWDGIQPPFSEVCKQAP